MQSPSGNLNLIFFQQLCKILPIMQPWIFFFRVFLNSNHKISRHKSSRKFPPHLTVVLIEFRSEIYDLKNTLRRRDTNQRPSTTKVQFSTMLHTMGSNQLWNRYFTGFFSVLFWNSRMLLRHFIQTHVLFFLWGARQ